MARSKWTIISILLSVMCSMQDSIAEKDYPIVIEGYGNYSEDPRIFSVTFCNKAPSDVWVRLSVSYVNKSAINSSSPSPRSCLTIGTLPQSNCQSRGWSIQYPLQGGYGDLQGKMGCNNQCYLAKEGRSVVYTEPILPPETAKIAVYMYYHKIGFGWKEVDGIPIILHYPALNERIFTNVTPVLAL
jgi:hypothetical protein